MTLVAAYGLDRAGLPLYPAAYDSVLLVNALKVNGKSLLSEQALADVPGLRVDAPGEDIWTSDESGKGFYATGSSFSAPIVTAAIASAAYQNKQSTIFSRLQQTAAISFSGLCNN